MKKLSILIILITIMTGSIDAQNPQWLVYDTSNSELPGNWVQAIAIDDNGTKWIGLYSGWQGYGDGLVSFDGTNWIVFDTANSALPDNDVRSIAIEEDGAKWIGTSGGGLAKFDGITWSIYNTSNSELPSNHISAIAIEEGGTKWIGTFNSGLVAYNGNSWIVYNTSNSGLSSNYINSITIEGNGTKWIATNGGLASFDDNNWINYLSGTIEEIAIDQYGTKWISYGGLASFDGVNWTFYNELNSDLPCPIVWSLAVEGNGTKWIGTVITPNPPSGCGLTSFDGVNWTTYNSNNSGLPDTYISSIAIDSNGTKWIGTRDGGLVAFNENGIPVTINEFQNERIDLSIYPNPTKDMINIKTNVQIKIIRIVILNTHGQIVISEIIEDYQKSIDIGGLPNGLYTIQAQNEYGVSVNKFIKK